MIEKSSRQTMVILIVLILFLAIGSNQADAQRSKPKVVDVVDGDSVYQVLPADAIPAISHPVFVSGKEANAQMSGDEPVMGIIVNGNAKAFSLWQLDAHEIVNDRINDTPVAVTW